MLLAARKYLRRYFNSRQEKRGGLRVLSRKDLIPPKFIDYAEAVKRISDIREILRSELEKRDAFKFLPSWAFYTALLGEAITLNRLNQREIKIPLPWDERIGLPSLPTLGADAAKCADFLEEKYPRMLFASFKEWILFWEATIRCGHGPRELKMRDVNYGVWVNHVLSQEGDTIVVKQFMCVRSDDDDHVRNHYCGYKPSKILDKSNLVWTSANKIRVHGWKVDMEDLGITAAKEVYDPQNLDRFQFGKRFLNIIKSANLPIAAS